MWKREWLIIAIDACQCFHMRNRKPSLEVAPTTLAQSTRQTNKIPDAVTYLQFQNSGLFLSDRAFLVGLLRVRILVE